MTVRLDADLYRTLRDEAEASGLALIAGALAAILGALWTLGRIARPWVLVAAREVADEVRAEVRALGDKLATNDFPHVEGRIDRVEARTRAELAAMEGRLGDRLTEGNARIEGALSEIFKRVDGIDARMTEGGS